MSLSSLLKKNKIPSTHSLLGIDLSDNYIKIAEVSWEKSAYRLLNFQCANLVGEQSWTDILEQLLEKNDFLSRQACIGLDSSSVVTKTVQLDVSLSEEELEIEVNERAHRYFNYPSQELLIDFEILAAHEENIQLRWIAAKKSEVIPKLNALEKLGIHTRIIDIKAYALTKFMRHMTSGSLLGELILLVHKADTILSLILYHQTNLLFFKEIIVPELNISMEEIQRAVADILANYSDKKLRFIMFSGVEISQKESLSLADVELVDIKTPLSTQPWLKEYSLATIIDAAVAIGLAMRVDECR